MKRELHLSLSSFISCWGLTWHQSFKHSCRGMRYDTARPEMYLAMKKLAYFPSCKIAEQKWAKLSYSQPTMHLTILLWNLSFCPAVHCIPISPTRSLCKPRRLLRSGICWLWCVHCDQIPDTKLSRGPRSVTLPAQRQAGSAVGHLFGEECVERPCKNAWASHKHLCVV